MDVVRLMGVEKREYPDRETGELKTYCGLHVVYEVSDNAEDVKGKKCESFSCPKNVDPLLLELGQTYELVYTHFKTKNGMGARISDLRPVEA